MTKLASFVALYLSIVLTYLAYQPVTLVTCDLMLYLVKLINYIASPWEFSWRGFS